VAEKIAGGELGAAEERDTGGNIAWQAIFGKTLWELQVRTLQDIL